MFFRDKKVSYRRTNESYLTKHVYMVDSEGNVVNTLEIVTGKKLPVESPESWLGPDWVVGISGKGYVFHKLEGDKCPENWSMWYPATALVNMKQVNETDYQEWLKNNALEHKIQLATYKGDVRPCIERIVNVCGVCACEKVVD